MPSEPIVDSERSVTEVLSSIEQRLARIESFMYTYEPLVKEAAARLAQPFWKQRGAR